MALTETKTRNIMMTVAPSGRIATIHIQDATAYTDEAGDLVSRTAGPAIEHTIEGFVSALLAQDRAALAAALA